MANKTIHFGAAETVMYSDHAYIVQSLQNIYLLVKTQLYFQPKTYILYVICIWLYSFENCDASLRSKFIIMEQDDLNQIMILLQATVSGHAYTQIHNWAKSNLELYQIRTNVVKEQTITMP